MDERSPVSAEIYTQIETFYHKSEQGPSFKANNNYNAVTSRRQAQFSKDLDFTNF